MRLQVASTVALLGAFTAADAFQIRRSSFLSLSANEASGALDPPTLQELLNRKCRTIGQGMCERGFEQFCNLSEIFARYETGTSSQQEKSWRCFLARELNFHASGPGCVDNCGNHVMCLGVNDTPSTEHLTRHQDLISLLQSEQTAYCKAAPPTLQEALDRKCYGIAKEACASGRSDYCDVSMYARYEGSQYRCYAESALNFTIAAPGCVDACGNKASCLGAVTETPAITPLDGDSVLSATVQSNQDAFCESQPLTLQDRLDQRCNQLGKEYCAKGSTKFCGYSTVARFDVGASYQREKQWRCYASASLAYDEFTEGCVDDCGNFVSCLGRVKENSTYHLTRAQIILDVLNTNKDFYCSKAAQQYVPRPAEVPQGQAPSQAGQPSQESGSHDGADATHDGADATHAPEQAPPQAEQQPQETPEIFSPETVEEVLAAGLLVGPGPPRVPGTGSLQEILDAHCIEKFVKKCLTNTEYCEYAVARKDEDGHYYCVASKQLNYRDSTPGCVDTCGKTISCLGKGSANTKHVAADELADMQNELATMTCNAPKHSHSHASASR